MGMRECRWESISARGERMERGVQMKIKRCREVQEMVIERNTNEDCREHSENH